MNTIASLPTPKSTPRVGSNPVWELEIMKLQANHVAIELVLKNPTGLSTEVLTQYYVLREELVATMEDFLNEMDRIDEKVGSPADMTKVLRKHALVMNKLNARVDFLVKKQQAMAN